MYAFWKYDLHPYILGGKLSKLEQRKDAKGPFQAAYVDSYQGWYRVEFLLGDSEGEKVVQQIQEARQKDIEEHNSLKERLKSEFNSYLAQFSKIT